MNLGHDFTDIFSGLWADFVGALLNNFAEWLISLVTGLFPAA